MNMSDTDYLSLTQTPLTQNTHRCTCVCRLRRVFSWSHADYAKFADLRVASLSLVGLPSAYVPEAHTSDSDVCFCVSLCFCVRNRKHSVRKESAKVCGVCVRQKTR